MSGRAPEMLSGIMLNIGHIDNNMIINIIII